MSTRIERAGSAARRRLVMGAVAMLASAVAATAAPPSAAPPDSVTVRMIHRVFAAFADTQTVRPGEEFYVGDTEYSAVIEGFNPDFGITKEGEVVQRSAVPHNPAFHVKVFKDGAPVDSVWAFLSTSPPHFRRNSLIGFQVLSFGWQGRVYHEPVPREKP